MSDTNIEWSDKVWNPTTGCSKVSPGCAHCYAETLTKRYAGRPGWPAEFKPWTPANAAENVVLHPDRLEAPLHWKTPRRVFVDSMSDLFHDDVPFDYIDKVFAVMALTPQHTFQVLTKRPARMREYFADLEERVDAIGEAIFRITGKYASGDPPDDDYVLLGDLPLPNVWLGVTVENQRWADERIPILLDTPAAVRFLSCEPLLGRINLKRLLPCPDSDYCCWKCGQNFEGPPLFLADRHRCPPGFGERLDWVIVGGESGPKHRPFDPDWARSIVAQCRDAGVACFVKQLGGARPGNKLDDLPEDLRVREFPNPAITNEPTEEGK